jgi:hypothetical protein
MARQRKIFSIFVLFAHNRLDNPVLLFYTMECEKVPRTKRQQVLASYRETVAE